MKVDSEQVYRLLRTRPTTLSRVVAGILDRPIEQVKNDASLMPLARSVTQAVKALEAEGRVVGTPGGINSRWTSWPYRRAVKPHPLAGGWGSREQDALLERMPPTSHASRK